MDRQLDRKKIGQYIRRKRERRNLSQSALAQQLGVATQSVYRWEAGRLLPDYNLLVPLAHMLGVTVSELCNGEDNREDSEQAEWDEDELYELMRKTQMKDRRRKNLIGFALVIIGLLFLLVRSSLVENGAETTGSTVVTVIGVVFIIVGICVTTRRNS